jgi:hypothetical protein
LSSLQRLGLGSALSPLGLAMTTLYVCGLILLERRQTATRMADWLPARAHDALNRLLVHPPILTRRLFGSVIQWAQHLGSGYLLVDEVLLDKPFGQKCAWIGWMYSSSRKRSVKAMCVVVVLFCVGTWRIPVAFRLWRPKGRCAAHQYRKRTELAWEMLQELALSGLKVELVAFDNFYTAGWLTKAIGRLGWRWVGILESKTHIRYRNRLWQAGELAAALKLKWREAFRVRAIALTAYLPKYGTLRLVVTRTRYGNFQVLASNALQADLSWIISCKRRRWTVETLFRDAKQFCGFCACQCRLDVAHVMHVALVFLAFVVVQMLRRDPKETLGSVKERYLREALTGHFPPPPMLKARVPASAFSSA